jgi:hypothetical protein
VGEPVQLLVREHRADEPAARQVVDADAVPGSPSGAGGLISGALLHRSSSLRANGVSHPLLTIGLLHLAVGIYVNVLTIAEVALISHAGAFCTSPPADRLSR